MGKERRRPSWWQLWLLLPALGILAFLEVRASLSPAGHRVVEVATILVIYGLVSVWLRANQAGLLRESRDGLSQTTVETVVYLPSEPGIIAGSNGNGDHEPAWYVPTHEPDADLHTAREELDR
jgi:hypothetical protein